MNPRVTLVLVGGELQDNMKLIKFEDYFLKVTFLSTYGGSDTDQTVKFLIEKLMEDSVAALFSLKGMRGKYAFTSLRQICIYIIEGNTQGFVW